MPDTNLLRGARVYLSGPMDFVASRENERKFGWRRRVGTFLARRGATVFDPWYKPMVRGLGTYGEEDERSIAIRDSWTFRENPEAAATRARCSKSFWPTMHIDLRMVDLSDFIIACCPTHLYSVGTPHEIVVARGQHKPVLFVSPPVCFHALETLEEYCRKDPELRHLIERLKREGPVKPNPKGMPSLWYMSLVDTESFFDGFGFADFVDEFKGAENVFDRRERDSKPVRPLLKFLDRLTNGWLPKRWNSASGTLVPNDDWLLLKLKTQNRKKRAKP